MASKQVDDFSSEFEVEDAPIAPAGSSEERESDPHRLAQRQKQIDFGKNTLGYQRYLDEVPRETRGKQHPNTPDVYQKTSKRAFDGQVKKWRRMLHTWDLPGDAEPTAAPQTESKNGENQRQPAAGLPLKMSAMRPTNNNNKRSHSFLAALLSPTMAPPESKVQKKINANTEGEPVVQEESHPSQALMAKWRDMVTGKKTNNSGPQNDIIEMIDAAVGCSEEVSYSEDEDEAVPMQAEAMNVVV